MVQFAIKSTALLAFVVLAQGAPVFKRIAQNTVDSKTQWEAACVRLPLFHTDSRTAWSLLFFFLRLLFFS